MNYEFEMQPTNKYFVSLQLKVQGFKPVSIPPHNLPKTQYRILYIVLNSVQVSNKTHSYTYC